MKSSLKLGIGSVMFGASAAGTLYLERKIQNMSEQADNLESMRNYVEADKIRKKIKTYTSIQSWCKGGSFIGGFTIFSQLTNRYNN